MDSNNIFEKWMFEADEDPPDMDDTPDIPDDVASDEGPPDIPDDFSDDSSTEDTFDTDGLEDMGDDYSDDNGDENSEGDLHLSDKVSAIMNNQLYQRFLSLLNNVGGQMTSINKNSDVLNTLLGDYYTELVESLKKLEENIRLYLDNTFINEDYSKNLLFFNMCLNLLKLLNDSFNDEVKKGIKKTD